MVYRGREREKERERDYDYAMECCLVALGSSVCVSAYVCVCSQAEQMGRQMFPSVLPALCLDPDCTTLHLPLTLDHTM